MNNRLLKQEGETTKKGSLYSHPFKKNTKSESICLNQLN